MRKISLRGLVIGSTLLGALTATTAVTGPAWAGTAPAKAPAAFAAAGPTVRSDWVDNPAE